MLNKITEKVPKTAVYYNALHSFHPKLIFAWDKK